MLITEFFCPLVHSYDENLDFEFDYPHFQDRAQDIQERNANLTQGVTSRNEERDKMGLEPVDGGDVILVSPMLVPLESVRTRRKKSRYHKSSRLKTAKNRRKARRAWRSRV